MIHKSLLKIIKTMKGLCLLFALILCLTASAHHKDLRQMDEAERNEYLVRLAKEVTMNFGPDFYREYGDPEISSPVFFDTWIGDDNPTDWRDVKNLGRYFYTVTFKYDRTKERHQWDYASQVLIWNDDGSPFMIYFATGYGFHFDEKSYWDWVKEGIKKEEQMPYSEIPMYRTDSTKWIIYD